MELTLENLNREIEIKGKTFLPLYKLAELEMIRIKLDSNLIKLYLERGLIGQSKSHLIFVSTINPNSSIQLELLGLNFSCILLNPYWVVVKLKEWGFKIDLDIENQFTRDYGESEIYESNCKNYKPIHGYNVDLRKGISKCNNSQSSRKNNCQECKNFKLRID